MSEDKREVKRPAVKARKSEAQLAKGARRKQRSGNGPRSHESYGNRSISRTKHGPAISITVQIPALRRPKERTSFSKQPVPVKRNRRWWPVLAVPAITLVGAVIYFAPFSKEAVKPVQTAAAERTEPNYQPLVPSAEKASATQYDAKRNLVSYTTTFSSARLTVSQQILPENFSKDPAATMKAADSIKATQQVETSKGMLYIATNDTAGDQLALIADKNVLIFVHSDKQLDEATWKSFIEQLEAKSWESVKS
jgi:hypothetical protein